MYYPAVMIMIMIMIMIMRNVRLANNDTMIERSYGDRERIE